MAQTQTFTDVQPIQQAQTFTNVTPIEQQQGDQPGFLDKTIPLDSYKNATLQGLQSVGRGVRDAVTGLGNMVMHPIDTAKGIADLPSQAAQVPGAIKDINQTDDPVGTYAKVAQETAGQGAGQALTALATEGIVKGASAAKPIVRGALKAASDVVDPDLTGIASPRLAHAQRLAGKIADKLGDKPTPTGKPLVSDTPLGPETPDPDLLKARSLTTANTPAAQPASQTGEALGQVPQRGAIAKALETPEAQPAAQPIRRGSLAQMLQDQLDQSLGAKKLDPTKPLRNQLDTLSGSKPAADLPEGHTPVQSSALRSYKYDPGAREFHARYSSGDATTHVFGDVAPEEAQAFGEAESKGKAMQQIKQGHPLVAKIVNGKRIPTRAISEQK